MSLQKRINLLIGFLIRHYFIVILIGLFVVLCCLKISGSSIGVYDTFFNGQYSQNQLRNEPLPIRSDEWLVATQLTIAQSENNYARFNNNFGSSKDMSVVVDVPYKEWSTVFKPQNLAFLVLPLEYAFAFKWWFLAVFLSVSIYLFCLKIMPRRYHIATLVSIIGLVSPFIFWWYQSITILPIAFGILALTLFMRIVDSRSLSIFSKTKYPVLYTYITLGTALVYSLVGFAFILYPAFQIPIALTAALIGLGYLINKRLQVKKIAIITTVISVIFTIIFVGAFIATRLDSIQTVSSTNYPGKRHIPPGLVTENTLFAVSGFAQYTIINDNAKDHLPSNQSNESAFVITSILFILPVIYFLIVSYKQRKKIDWVLVAILILNCIFLLHYFAPWSDFISDILFLYLVPQERLSIGLGVLGLISMVIMISKIQSTKNNSLFHPRQMLILFSVILAAYNIFLALLFEQLFPGLVVSTKQILLFSLIVSSGIILVLTKKYVYIGLITLAVFSSYVTINTQPLYSGLDVITKDPTIAKIKQHSSPENTWGITGDLMIENFPTMAGRSNITGTQFYPDNTAWEKLVGNDDSSTYNRYAHIVLNPNIDKDVDLIQADYYHVSLKCDTPVSNKIDRVLSTVQLDLPCYEMIDSTNYPSRTIYIYKKL